MGRIRARNCLAGIPVAIGTVVLTTAVAALALLSSPASTVSACTPPPGGNPQKTVADRVAAADLTIEGTISSLSGEVHLANQVAKISVDRYITGGGPALLTVSRYGTSGLCLSAVSLGQHALFYIDETATGYQAFYLTQFDAVAPANPANITEAVEAAGHPPSLPDPRTRARAIQVALDYPADPPAAVQLARSTNSSPGWIIAGFGMTALASAGVVAVRARPNGRK